METQKTTAKDFFLHLGTMVALYSGTIALLNLLFRIINTAYPQIEYYGYGGGQSISFPVATLIVAFPLFLFLSNILQKGYAVDPSKKEFAVRRWLVYITLFIAGVVLAGDLVTLIYFFLDGRELTAGFVLKVLSVFVVTGGVFGYYMDDLRGRLTGSRRNMWRLVALVLVLGAIVIGFSIMGSPKTQRLHQLDMRKVNDLQNIQSQIIQYWQMKGSLPQDLNALNDSLSYNEIPVDPETGNAYEYVVKGSMSFSLCAQFNRDSQDAQGKSRVSNAMYYVGMQNENWQYSQGHSCFDRTVDPERYPVYPKPGI